ncbi:MAG: hypothetical protein NDI90_19485 [Nitrospira sp. BO4]|jgi:hypothetical protein|nr:hypothetical protein [Nitrospira sp. BO4]
MRMVRNHKYRRFVIFSGTKRRKSPGTRFIATDGTTTNDRVKAAKFYTLSETTAFVRENGITLSDRTSIEQEDFSEAEVSSRLRMERWITIRPVRTPGRFS